MVEYIVQCKIRAYIKAKGLNTGGDTLEALDKQMSKLIDAAAKRAKANDRKTLMAKDC